MSLTVVDKWMSLTVVDKWMSLTVVDEWMSLTGLSPISSHLISREDTSINLTHRRHPRRPSRNFHRRKTRPPTSGPPPHLPKVSRGHGNVQRR